MTTQHEERPAPAPSSFSPRHLAAVSRRHTPGDLAAAAARPALDAHLCVLKHHGRPGFVMTLAGEHDGLTGEPQRQISWLDQTAGSSDAFLAGFSALVTSLPSDRLLRVGIVGFRFLSQVRNLEAAWPHLEFVCVAADEPEIAASRDAALEIACPGVTSLPENGRCPHDAPIDECGLDASGRLVRRVVCATDGSSGGLRGPKVSGYGWICDNGLHGDGTIENRYIINAELTAVLEMLRKIRGPLKILVDSSQALDIISLARTGEVAVPSTVLMPGLFGKLRAALADRDVEFEKVAGHSGHPLNDGADRLALHARRSATSDVDPMTHRRTRRDIVTQTVEAWKDFGGTVGHVEDSTDEVIALD